MISKIVIMIIVLVIQFTISMTTTPSLVKVTNSDTEMTMGQSWPIALVQMLLMIVGFLCVTYLGTEKEADNN
jgi:hypothetical protein